MSVKLTDEVKVEIIRLRSEGLSSRLIGSMLGVGKSTVNDFLAGETHEDWWKDYKPVASGSKYDHWKNLPRLKGKRFIISSAQNNTYVHKEFVEALHHARDYYQAQILISPFTYNRNGFNNLEKGDNDLWYDPKIRDYLITEPVMLADDLVFCAELNILPTAVNPLSGLQGYTRRYSGIIPHVKVQLESLPSHKSKPPRTLFTTGTVTQRNYIEQKAGQKASFHHVFGALLVEVDDDGTWFVRQLIAETDTGTFYDLNTKFTSKGIEEGCRVEGITYGDIHSEKRDKKACDASYGKTGDSMLDVLQPKYQFVHDVLDFTTRNHHNRNDPYFRWRTYGHKVDDDFGAVIEDLLEMDRDYVETVVVSSNHHDAFTRWLREGDYKNDSPENALVFLEAQAAMVRSVLEGDKDFDVFKWYLQKREPLLESVRFLKVDESFMICGDDDGIEQGCHGHTGSNGSRGGVAVYQKMGTRHNIGHGHSPTIKDGVVMVGVLGSLDMGYNIGASSWQHANCVTYVNGKRALYFIKNGKWRVED